MRRYKSNLLGNIAVLLILVLLSSCGKKKKTEETPQLGNHFYIGDALYEMSSGTIINNGQVDTVSDLFRIDLRLYAIDHKNFVNFGIISKYAEKISDGTYTMNSEDVQGSWVLGYNDDGSYSSMGNLTSGKFVVSRDSGGYLIEINATDKYGNSLTGTYRGNLSNKDVDNSVHQLPNYVCPDEIYNGLTQYFPIFSGVNPPDMTGEYVSAPNALIYESYVENHDTIIIYSDRYLGFIYDSKQLNFYGKQYDPVQGKDIEEIYYGAKITGDNDNFTCYFVVDGYVSGYYSQQSFIFSGKKTNEGIENYHSAVVLLETSGNPNMLPKNSYRVLKDLDGLAEAEDWMSKGRAVSVSKDNADLFKIWMK